MNNGKRKPASTAAASGSGTPSAPKRAKVESKTKTARLVSDEEKVKKDAAKAKAAQIKTVSTMINSRVVNEKMTTKYDVADAKQLAAGVARLKSGHPVVFCNLITADDAAGLISKFWDYMEEACAGLKRADPTTWTNERWPGIFSVGILKCYGIGQSAFMWAVRTLPRIRTIYQVIYGTDKLYTSFDSCGVIRGAEYDVAFNHSWLHVDQNLKSRPAMDLSFQGALNLVAIGEDAAEHGSFMYVPGSATEYKTNFDAGLGTAFLGTGTKQYCPLPLDHSVYAGIADGTKSLCALSALNVGDFTMWPSPLVHAARMPSKSTLKSQLRRLVAYVTLQPFSALGGVKDERELSAKKRAAAASAATTSHWPCDEPTTNQLPRPRHKSMQPVVTPKSCNKTQFSPNEAALVDGTSPA